MDVMLDGAAAPERLVREKRRRLQMTSRKNLILASLVSLVMVLSFGIGLAPMLTASPDHSAKAAP